MRSEAAVERLAELVAARPEFTEEELYEALSAAGFSHAVIDRAYKFTQTAWGRAFLDGLGVQFGSDYVCLDAAGEVIESGRLADHPFYSAAVRLAETNGKSPGFLRLATMSADVNAVNHALNAGSKPEDLVTGPAVFFMEAPTPEGREKARRLLAERAATAGELGISNPAAGKKPWWRIW